MTLSYLPRAARSSWSRTTPTPGPAHRRLQRESGSGYGLTGMRERAELLGGELLAMPTPHGFRVELRLPA